jgi:hypothetical protein
MAKQYRVNVGIDYPAVGTGKPRRAEPGDIVDDLRKIDADWMLRDHIIEEVD